MKQRNDDSVVFESLIRANRIAEVYKRLSEEDRKILESLERIRLVELQVMMENEG